MARRRAGKGKRGTWADRDFANKTVGIAARLREPTAEALKREAARNLVTLSSQTETCIADALAAGPPSPTDALSVLVATAIDSMKKMAGPPDAWKPITGADWTNDAYVHACAREAVLHALDVFRPTDKALSPEEIELAGGDPVVRGRAAVDSILNDARLISPDSRAWRATTEAKRRYQTRLRRIMLGFGALLRKPSVLGEHGLAAQFRRSLLTEQEWAEFRALAGRITAWQFVVEAAERKAGRTLTEQDIGDFLPDDPEQRSVALAAMVPLTPEERARYLELFDKAGFAK